MKTNLAVLISGRGSNLKAIIDSINSDYLENVELKLVIANKQCEGLKHADEISYVIDNDKEILKALQLKKIDLICLAGYDAIIGKEIISRYKNRIMNIHPSLLPAFPNTMHAQQKAFDYGVKITGCTVHFVTNEVDAGQIIIQAAVPVKDNDTEKTLNDRILEQEHIIYPKAIKLFSEGKLKVEGRKVRIDSEIELEDITELDISSLTRIGVCDESIGKLLLKSNEKITLIKNITPREAMILKQEMLSLGGDCAVPKECCLNTLVPLDVILIGNAYQIQKLKERLKEQAFDLPKIGEKL